MPLYGYVVQEGEKVWGQRNVEQAPCKNCDEVHEFWTQGHVTIGSPTQADCVNPENAELLPVGTEYTPAQWAVAAGWTPSLGTLEAVTEMTNEQIPA